MSDWTVACCEACWIIREGTWERIRRLDGEGEGDPEVLVGLRLPYRLVTDEPQIEQCGFCGQPTFVGIYVRVDPATVPYPKAASDG